MAEQQSVARKQSRSKRDKKQEADPGTGKSGHEDEVARSRAGTRGLPARTDQARPQQRRHPAPGPVHRQGHCSSRASERHARGGPPEDESRADAEDDPSAEADDEPSAEADDEPGAEADDEPGAEADDEPSAEADDEPGGEADDEPSAETDDEESAESEAPPDFEADMRELQAELGEHWILRFSVQGDDGWLTAEKDDGSQRIEAPDAAVLVEVVGLLNDRGGRST